MALNTPKRVRTLASFASSPPPSHGGQSPQLGLPQQWNSFGVSASSSGQFNGFNGVNSVVVNSTGPSSVSHHGTWMDGSLSPVSSCDSPEFSVSNRAHSAMPQSSQKYYPGTGVCIMPAVAPSPQQQHHQLQLDNRENNRRGRPRSEALTTLMFEGSTSPSAIKCTFCNRVFPREKSLQAHLRTHTGKSFGVYIILIYIYLFIVHSSLRIYVIYCIYKFRHSTKSLENHLTWGIYLKITSLIYSNDAHHIYSLSHIYEYTIYACLSTIVFRFRDTLFAYV